jgi:hypothetical protein
VVATGLGVETPAVGSRVTVFPNPGSWTRSAMTSPRRWSVTR